ncbi:MAG: hypothetical protein PHO70_03975 [Candidatus Omnitrophica bacterium]|nr:hypothetical protein [Candidatus Omnitrophota bacterium]
MAILMGFAIITLILGLLFIGGQDVLKKLSDGMNKIVIEFKAPSEKESKFVGVFLIVFSIVLFFVASRLR